MRSEQVYGLRCSRIARIRRPWHHRRARSTSGALVGHERGEGHDLVLRHAERVANASLGREPMMAVLGAVTLHDQNLPVVPPNWKPDSIDRIARANLAEDVRLDVGVTRSCVEVLVDVVEEAGRRGHEEEHSLSLASRRRRRYSSVSASDSNSVWGVGALSLRRTRTPPSLAYQTFGENGPPVLFVMGFGMPGAVWGPQVDELQNDHRCVHYDHLGVGESDRGPFLRTIPAMADDAVRILDDLSWDRAHVVGVSMGGMIAQELALRSADRCQSLTLIATHGGAPVASLPTLRGMRFFVQGLFGGPKNRMRSLPRLLYPDEFLESIGPTAIRSHLDVRLGHPPALRTVLGQLYAVWRHSTESRLSEIQTPTLLVRPGKDILIRRRRRTG